MRGRISIGLSVLALAFLAEMAPAMAQGEFPADCRSDAPSGVAIEACTKFLSTKAPPKLQVSALIRRGNAYKAAADLEAALRDYDAALKLDPKSDVAYNQRGLTLRRMGDYDRAIESYSAAIKLQPKDSVLYSNRGVAYRRKGDLDRALSDLNAAIGLDPKRPEPFLERAVVHRLKLEFSQALADNDQAIKLSPKDAYAFKERAHTQEGRNELKSALSDYRQALLLDPNDTQVARSISRLETRVAVPVAKPASTPSANATKAQPTATGKGRRVALVIGNSRYSNVSPLINPRNDAELIGNVFRAVGFTQVHLKVDLSREQLAIALKEFANVADDAEWAVIYYAGHGIEVGGQNYLVPVDAKFATDRDVSLEAVTLDQVLQSVEGARKLRLVILDACRDNPFARKMVRSSGTRSVRSGLGNIEPEGATLVAYAAKHGLTAEDGAAGNSPFATSLARFIQEPGLEINLVFRKVRDDVMASTGKRQEPFTYGSLPSEAFYFRQK